MARGSRALQFSLNRSEPPNLGGSFRMECVSCSRTILKLLSLRSNTSAGIRLSSRWISYYLSNKECGNTRFPIAGAHDEWYVR